MVFMWLPMYCAYLNFSVWVLRASVTFSFLQNWLDNFWCIWVFDTYLPMFGYLVLVVSNSRFQCSLL